jgi:hypothetical protein
MIFEISQKIWNQLHQNVCNHEESHKVHYNQTFQVNPILSYLRAEIFHQARIEIKKN